MKKSYINLKTLVSFAFAGLLLSSCQKKLDEAFANPNAGVRVPVESLLPG
jgi:hypothetical protein